jgi:hypothetical protein
MERSGIKPGQSATDHLGGRLSSVVGTNVLRNAADEHNVGQCFDDVDIRASVLTLGKALRGRLDHQITGATARPMDRQGIRTLFDQEKQTFEASRTVGTTESELVSRPMQTHSLPARPNSVKKPNTASGPNQDQMSCADGRGFVFPIPSTRSREWCSTSSGVLRD